MPLPNVVDLESLVLAAFRTDWRQVTKATTGTVTTITAHADGHYSRNAGSFLDDGFDVGDEATVAGYVSGGGVNNGMKWCEFVDDTTMQVRSLTTMVDEAAPVGGVSIAMGLPALQKLDGEALDPEPDRPWLSESFQPNELRPASIGGATAGKPLARLTGFYWLTTHYPIKLGNGGVIRLRGKFNARIYPGRSLVYLGHTIRVQRASPKPTIEKGGYTSGALAIGFQADALNP